MTGGHEPGSRPGFFRRMSDAGRVIFGTPRQAIGWESIEQNARLIDSLWQAVNRKSRNLSEVRFHQGGRIDVLGTAALHRVPPGAVLALLAIRQRDTYRRAYGAGLLVCFLMTAWIIEMVAFTWTGSRWLAAVEFLPFWSLLTLVAFRNAWLNWQLRERRIASWRNFLDESDTLFPRLP